MRELIRTTLSILIIVCVVSGSVKAQDEITNAFKEQIIANMTGLSGAPSTQWQGMAMTITANDTYWTTTIGQANDTGLEIDPNGKWILRSFTKMMNSIIILKLYEEGSLNLKDPISEYLDPISNVEMSDTIEDLLHMRSRMCQFINDSDSVWDQVDDDPDAVLDTKTMLELHLPTGPCNEQREYDYNDANFQVLGLVIEAVTGKSGEDVFNERIIEPYGLESMALSPLDLGRSDYNGYYKSDRIDADNVFTYDNSELSINSLLTSQKFSAGAMGSTGDMLKLTKALLDSTILNDSTLALMKHNPVDTTYGKGLMIQEMKGEINGDSFGIALYPGKFYGHGGAARNTIRTFYDPERKIGFSFAFNSSTPSFNAIFSTEKFKENTYGLLRKCIIDKGCITLPNESENFLNIERFDLAQNYPNPFNPSTNISFTLPQAGDVSLRVFNMLGQEVANLVNERKVAGFHTVNFDASGLSSGVYIYQLVAGDISQTKKMLLIK